MADFSKKRINRVKKIIRRFQQPTTSISISFRGHSCGSGADMVRPANNRCFCCQYYSQSSKKPNKDSQWSELIVTLYGVSEVMRDWGWAWTSAWQDGKDHIQARLSFLLKAPGNKSWKDILSKWGGYQRWHLGDVCGRCDFYDLCTLSPRVFQGYRAIWSQIEWVLSHLWACTSLFLVQAHMDEWPCQIWDQ